MLSVTVYEFFVSTQGRLPELNILHFIFDFQDKWSIIRVHVEINFLPTSSIVWVVLSWKDCLRASFSEEKKTKIF